MTTRSFDARDLRVFADLSGDHNPLHVDPEIARRTMTGEQTMHGVLGALWALDCALDRPLALARLAITFRRPVVVGEYVEWRGAPAVEGETTKAIVTGDDRVRFDMATTWVAQPNRAVELPSTGPAIACRDITFEEAATRSGTLPLYVDVDALARLLPRVAARLPREQLAFLLATTRLVGMECPGLHSLYVALDLRFEDGEPEREVRWRVSSANHNHKRLVVELASGGMRGTLTAFMRPRPVEQPAFAAISDLVQPGEFAGQRALIVGGSRGLGEIAAKLITAGGGDVIVTYHRGVNDAARVVEEIRANGGPARALPLDVRAPEDLIGALAGWTPTDLHYFASPRIDFGRPGTFSAALFDRFCAYYVGGYASVRTALRANSSPLRVLYASSEAVTSDEPGVEYAAAKAAGEVVCSQLARHFGDVLHAPRFPRMHTDQTASVLALPSAAPAPIVLEAVRRLRAIS